MSALRHGEGRVSLRQLIAVVLILACVRLWSLAGEPTGTAVALAPAAGAAISSSFSENGPHSTDPAQRFYDRIAHELLRGDCEAALHGFRLFLELYGQTPFAPFAEFWRGDCEFRLGLYAEALTSFDAVLARPAVPVKLASASLMRKGMSYARLGEPARSRHTLELVVVQFPDTQAADVARQALMAMASPGSPSP